MTRRKHHCRMCGLVFCDQCSGFKAYLSGLSAPERVCMDCYSPTNSVVDAMWRIYERKLRPMEAQYKFTDFYSPLLRKSDFEAKPQVLLLGQYSVGKTSFIKYLLERDFPGIRIGPEPTTDRFVAIMKGNEDRVVPGNALSVDATKPFHGVDKFGTGFLSKFESSECDAPILDNVTFIDTPGVLSGQKQRIGRSYDFTETIGWFADKSDLILLLFDAHKLDISDEFQSAIQALKGHDDKIRVVLNKADTITTQQLMRVYGALMWSLGKVFNTPETVRVYIGSFWSQPYQNAENEELFAAEQADLLRDLYELPRNSVVRRVNDLVKRARLLRVHTAVISHLKKNMPSVFGKQKAQTKMIDGLAEIFLDVHREFGYPVGDFPPVETMQAGLLDRDFTKFPRLDESMMKALDTVLTTDLTQIMNKVTPPSTDTPSAPTPSNNPFADDFGDPPAYDSIVSVDILKESESAWSQLEKNEKGALGGDKARSFMMESGLPGSSLRQIWELCDTEELGYLSRPQFTAVCYFIALARDGSQLPSVMPEALRSELNF
eukprot:TRINITY_DN2133_c0_g1_i3.p1 TRINITY_DN2133_c0_g1~~TRINITY_DN2133_c0_g1_i3.p1  ORF type:complete len:589 (-),score=115.85 TRINITY_DN2133_c0_g1_i3:45-1685(-)